MYLYNTPRRVCYKRTSPTVKGLSGLCALLLADVPLAKASQMAQVSFEGQEYCEVCFIGGHQIVAIYPATIPDFPQSRYVPIEPSTT